MKKEIRWLLVMVAAGVFWVFSATGQDTGSGGDPGNGGDPGSGENGGDDGSDDEDSVAECDQAPSQDTQVIQHSFFLSLDEGTGAKYRKVGLNGYPIPDEKPQAAAES
ncbi:MAG: hypothetical protein ACOYM3_17815, partial [Terrimicrobiaceae bacterium]